MYAMLIARDDGSFFYALWGKGMTITDFGSVEEVEKYAKDHNIELEWITDKYQA